MDLAGRDKDQLRAVATNQIAAPSDNEIIDAYMYLYGRYLEKNADGSLSIWLASSLPRGIPSSNWLAKP